MFEELDLKIDSTVDAAANASDTVTKVNKACIPSGLCLTAGGRICQ